MKRDPANSAARSRRPAGRNLRAVVALAVLGCLLLGAPAHAQAPEPDLATYTGWVREAFAAAQRSDRLGLEQVAEQLTATEGVRLPGGARVAVDNRWLRDALSAADPDLPAIARRLGAIIDALAQPDSAAPADAHTRLQQILDRPPFKQADPDSAANRWWRDFWEWIFRVLDSILSPIGPIVGRGGPAIGWVIGGIGAVLLIAVMLYLLIGLRRGMVAEARVAADDPEARLTAKTALSQAGDLARGGDYRTAVRYLYLSALLWMDERGTLRYDRALTNREYLERMRDNPALRERLAPIVETFDRVWYGHAAIDAESFAAYREQIEALRDERVTR